MQMHLEPNVTTMHCSEVGSHESALQAATTLRVSLGRLQNPGEEDSDFAALRGQTSGSAGTQCLWSRVMVLARGHYSGAIQLSVL